MLCPKCQSPNTESKRKYKPGEEIGRQRYSGLNINRRRLVCLDCKITFYTIELTEEDYHRFLNVAPSDTKARIR